jgi:hypothetical protein
MTGGRYKTCVMHKSVYVHLVWSLGNHMPCDAVFVSGLSQHFDSTGYWYVESYEGQADWCRKPLTRCPRRSTSTMRTRDNAMCLTALLSHVCHVSVHFLRMSHSFFSRLQFFYCCAPLQKLKARALLGIFSSLLTLITSYWKELLFAALFSNISPTAPPGYSDHRRLRPLVGSNPTLCAFIPCLCCSVCR